MDWGIFFSVVSGLVGLLLSGFAIWLSMDFYAKSKTTELNVATALAEIKAQTAALERITARQLDRFTRHATSVKPPDPQLAELTSTFSLLVQSLTPSQSALATPMSGSVPPEQLVQTWYNVMYFAGMANIGWNRQLLPPGQRAPEDEFMVRIVDETNRFFYAAMHVLEGTPLNVLQAAGVSESIVAVKSEIDPLIRTSHTVEGE